MRTGSPSPVSAMSPSPGFANEVSSTNDTGKASYPRLSSAALPRPDTKAPDEGSQIELWRESATFETDHEVGEIATRLFKACLDALTFLLRFLSTSISKREVNLLRRCHATIKLWGDGHGIEEGNLDRILDSSKNLQHMILSVLNGLCKALLSGIKLHIAPDMKEDAAVLELTCRTAEIYRQTKCILESHDCNSNSGSDNSSDSDTSEDDLESSRLTWVVEDVKISTDCLVDLNATLNSPAVDPVHDDEPSLPRVEQRAAHEYHSDLIRAKFPQANLDLVDCLGKTSWNRYCRLQQLRESNIEANIHTETQVQSTAKSEFADSEFKDSGLGTSIPAAPSVSYAETVISFMTSITGGSRVRIPPLSAEAKKGAKFECSACGKHIKATNNRDWRKHLFLDIQPYSCFYARCSFNSKPFADRKLWIKHLELDHGFGPEWHAIECPLCFRTTDSGKSSILMHFARHMEDIALSALPCEVESDAESDNESDDDTINFEPTSDCVKSSNQIMGGFFLYTCRLCHHRDTDQKSLLTHLRDFHNKSADEADLHIERTVQNPEHTVQWDEVFDLGTMDKLPPINTVPSMNTLSSITLPQIKHVFQETEERGTGSLPPIEKIMAEAQHQHLTGSPKEISDFISKSFHRDFKCFVCMESFSTDGQLKLHIELCPESYYCGVCSYGFHFEASLKEHMQSVHTVWEEQPLSKPRREYKSYHPPGTKFHSYQGPGEKHQVAPSEEESRKQSSPPNSSSPISSILDNAILAAREENHRFPSSAQDLYPDFQKWEFDESTLKAPANFSLMGQSSSEFDKDSSTDSTHSLPDPLTCTYCLSEFRGRYRMGNLARHKRHKHKNILQLEYPCENQNCARIFKRQDARLKHYRQHHPHLVDAPRLGKTGSLSTPQQHAPQAQMTSQPDQASLNENPESAGQFVRRSSEISSHATQNEFRSPISYPALLYGSGVEFSQSLMPYPTPEHFNGGGHSSETQISLRDLEYEHPDVSWPLFSGRLRKNPQDSLNENPENVGQFIRGIADAPWTHFTAREIPHSDTERNIPLMSINGVPVSDSNFSSDFIPKETDSMAGPSSGNKERS